MNQIKTGVLITACLCSLLRLTDTIANAAEEKTIVNSVSSFCESQLEDCHRLLVQSETNEITVYRTDGSEECSFTGSLPAASDLLLAKEGEGAVILDKDTNTYHIYRIGDAAPAQLTVPYLEQLSETVFSDQKSFPETIGYLYAADGTRLSEERSFFTRLDEYIFSYENIYDWDGNYLSSHPAFSAAEKVGNTVIGENQENGAAVLYDLEAGEVVWTAENRSFVSVCENRINWSDSSYQGYITDLSGNEVLREADWKELNQEWEIDGHTMEMISAEAQTGECIIQTYTQNGTALFLCNEQYEIQEKLSPDQMCFCRQEDKRIPFDWSLSDEGTLLIENFWTKERTEVVSDAAYGEVEKIAVTKADDVWGITIYTADNESTGILYRNGEILACNTGAAVNTNVVRLDENIIAAYQNKAGKTNVIYFVD